MKSFEIEHWGKKVRVVELETMVYQLYYDDELIASVCLQTNTGRSRWTSPNLDDSDANLIGSIITSKLF